LRACLAATAVGLAVLALSGCGSGNSGTSPTTVPQRSVPVPAADAGDLMLAQCARRTGANRGCPRGKH